MLRHQDQWPNNHDARWITPPDPEEEDIWVVRRNDSRSPTVWSNDAGGAIIHNENAKDDIVDEVYTVERSHPDKTMHDIMLNDPGVSGHYGLDTSSETVQPITEKLIPRRLLEVAYREAVRDRPRSSTEARTRPLRVSLINSGIFMMRPLARH